MSDETPVRINIADSSGDPSPLERRSFLSNMWKAGAVLVGAAGLWTSWDLIKPLPSAGFGGLVRSVPPEAVPEVGVVEVPAARSYLTRINGEIVAINEKCTHLGCKVPFCATSGQFECPCHGSVFNRAGEFLAGPAPRGMDRFPIEVADNGLIYIDTGSSIDGAAPGVTTIDEPPTGPSCATEGRPLMAYDYQGDDELEASTNRVMLYGAGLLFAMALVFPLYRWVEPTNRADAREEQLLSLQQQGEELFDISCSSCHGIAGEGGVGPALNSKQFLASATDEQAAQLIAVGVPGSQMNAYSQEYGGPLTSEQIRAITTFMRSWEETAPDVPDWRAMLGQ